MIQSLLIANRGEIACRIIRTAKKLGIRTIAVYSEADSRAPHVMMADEAFNLGAPPALQSYLNIDKIIEACHATRAEAVHPGYGFLSENVNFVNRLLDEGIVFIGPNPKAMMSLGDKIASKALAVKAGVSVLPGSGEALADADEALDFAKKIGFPVIIKASAGGGGKGMRIARNDEELKTGFQLAKSEALSSFNDERVFLEKFIDEPRHIEIQVLGDKHGNVVHLGERECSLQRRNQKVVEETPSSYIDAATRSAMTEQAILLAQAVGYDSAGTVEFIVDAEAGFYFLEMNTRLQVEHPVTECVTGLDLVEQMIRVGSGERLNIKQEDISFQGWAIECRLNAEDPARNFLPSTGRLETLIFPPEQRGGEDLGPTVRIDTGVAEGSEISLFYDSMVAKFITHAPTREAATEAMKHTLDQTSIKGVRTNLAFLSKLMNMDNWASGAIATTLIDKTFPDGFQPDRPCGHTQQQVIALAALINIIEEKRKRQDKQAAPHDEAALKIAWLDHETSYAVEIIYFDQTDGKTSAHIRVGDAPHDLERFLVKSDRFNGQEERPSKEALADDLGSPIQGRDIRLESHWAIGQPLWHGRIDENPCSFRVRRNGIAVTIEGGDHQTDVHIFSQRVAQLANLMPVKQLGNSQKQVICPMPGLVKSLFVSEGQSVEAGDSLCVIEAMKMENILRAEISGTIKTIHANVGDNLAVDTVIIDIE